MPYPDDVFAREARIGHLWASRVAESLTEAGVLCKLTPLEIEPDKTKIARFENEQDITLDVGGHLEVKSRNLTFTTDPMSFPHDDAFVDTVSGWDKKSPRPLAVVVISQHTGAKIVVPTSTEPQWGKKRSWDHVRKIEDVWYLAHKSLIRPFDELVEWLLARQERRTQS